MTVYIKAMRSMVSLLIAGREETDKLHCSDSIPETTYLVRVPNFYHLSVEWYIQQTDGWGKSQLKTQEQWYIRKKQKTKPTPTDNSALPLLLKSVANRNRARPSLGLSENLNLQV